MTSPLIGGFIASVKTKKDISPEWEYNLKKILIRFVSFSRIDPGVWTQEDVDTCFKNVRSKKGFKTNYRRTLIGHGKAFCKWLAKQNKDLNLEDITEIETPAVQWKTKSPGDMLTIKEVETLIKSARNNRDKLFIAMAYDTSCRPNELLKLRWEDVKGDQYGYYFKTSGKTGKERHIRLTNISIPYLEHWRGEHRDPSPGQYVFTTVDKNELRVYSMRNVNRMIAALRKNTGIKKLKSSIFRPSRITHDVTSKVDQVYVQMKNWGHLSKMIDLYSNIGTEYVDEIALRHAGMKRRESEDKTVKNLEPPVCPACGEVNPFGFGFCGVCKTPLTEEAKQKSESVSLKIDEMSLKDLSDEEIGRAVREAALKKSKV